MDTKSLTGFRFIAALIIVNFHYGRNAGFSSLAKNFFDAGPMILIYFFVLSGFILTYSYLKRDHFSARDFLVARISRIFPLYFLALAISLPLKLSIFDLTRFDLKRIFLVGTFLQAWFPPYALEFNAPAWAISAQMFFYLLFPMIIIYLRKIKPKISSVWFVSISVHLLTQLVIINLLNSDFKQASGSINHMLISYFPLAHLSSFLLGVAGGYYTHHSRWYLEKGTKFIWSLMGGVSLFLIFNTLNTRLFARVAGYRMPTSGRLMVPMFLLLIFLFINKKNALRLIFQVKPLLFLGEASYAIYILQSPLYRYYILYLAPALELEGSIIFYLYALLLVIVSILVYLGIEKPANNWIKKILRRKPKPVSPQLSE